MNSRFALGAAILLLTFPAFAQQLPDAPKPHPAPNRPAAPAQQPSKPVALPAASPSPSAPSAASATPAAQPVDPAKAAAVRHLMEVTGSAKLGDEVGSYLIAQVHDGAVRGITPDARFQKFMEAFNKEFASRYSSSEVMERAVTIYAAHLSLEDIQAISQFYESPVGQRMIQALPQIVQDSQAAGVQIGQKAAMDSLRTMMADYPELKDMLPSDSAAAPGVPAGAPAPNSPAPSAPKPAAPPTNPGPGR